MKTPLKYLLIVLLLPIFVTCDFDNNNDYYNYYSNYKVDIATVENPNDNSEFFFRLDDGRLMWTSSSVFRNFRPKDGQRIIAYYTLLADKRATGLYDYDVRLENVHEVLTKKIFAITPETQDSIGNDSISVQSMWIGSDYLNVQFKYFGNNKVHFINLVSDPLKEYTDGKIHLEFRHNANDDAPFYFRKGIVSFDISELKAEVSGTTLDLVIHVNIPDQAEDKLYSLTYNFGSSGALFLAPEIRISEDNSAEIN
jgi:hypothetical protein